MVVKEKKASKIVLKGRDGNINFVSTPPMLVIGNLFMGQQFIEPQGTASIKNLDTGHEVSIEFKARGAWSTRNEDLNFVSGSVVDGNGVEKYQFFGKFTEELKAKNMETGQVEVLTRAQRIMPTQQDPKKIYGINMLALQMNNLNDKLKSQLPPTDTRLRPDLRAWEAAELDLASKEKDRLEENQRKRRKMVKEEL